MHNLIPRVEFLLQAFVHHDVVCPYCKSNDTPVITRKYCIIRIRKCSNCRLIFTDPLYKTRLALNLYDRLYSAEGSTTLLPDPNALLQLKTNNFRGSDKDFTLQIESIKRFAPKGSLLEIGSSWGYFLYQAGAHGFDAVGIEVGEGRRKFGADALGVSIVRDFDELRGREFNVIFTAHVLEHFLDLHDIFPRIKKCLIPGGKLVVEVPYFNYKHDRARAKSIIGAVHPLGFTPEFFMHALPDHGLRILGFFDSWESVPGHPGLSSGSPVIILVAEKNKS